MVKYVADHGLQLPVQDPAHPGEWRQEGSQPPLYYMMGAALTFWIDTSDLDVVRRVNPHADIGVIVPDGNANMMVHDPARESFPWHGAALAVHLVRLLSVALGGLTVWMTYLLACELFPITRAIALGAAAITAFNPMFLFISGSVNNDNLSTALASVLLVLIVRLIKQTGKPSVRQLILIGVIAGAGLLAKFNIGFLLPFVALALAIRAWRLRDARVLIVGGAITGGLAVLIAGWWYVRNAQLYGDVTGLNVFLQLVGSRAIPADARQLWSERHSFLMSYWGFFGGVNVSLPDLFYTVFNAIAALSGVGALLWLIDAIRRAVISAKKGIDTSYMISRTLSRLLTAIWIVTLFVSLLRWTSSTWASQGRLIFAAIAPLSVWMAVGLWQIGHMGRAVRLIKWRPLAYSMGWFVMVAALGLLVVNRTYDQRTYTFDVASTVHITEDKLFADFCEPDHHQSCITVIHYGQENDPTQLPVGHYFQFGEIINVPDGDYEGAKANQYSPLFTRDWSAFIHIVNDDGLIIAQRDVYLKGGTLATTLLDGSAQEWFNKFAVYIPDYAYAPQKVHVCMGFYDLASGQRLLIGDSQVRTEDTDNNIFCTRWFMDLVPRDSSLNAPNPMSANFSDQTELVGYDISRLTMQPAEQVTLTLYWRAKQKITADYHVFVHIVDPATTTIFGQDDSMPAAWTRPTSTWQPGEIIKDAHTFTIRPDAPPGTWQIEVGMYQPTPDGKFDRLRVFTPDGGDASDYVYLSRVLIKPLDFF